MKKSDLKKDLSRKPVRKKKVSGYVACLPEFENDLSDKVDFDKPLSDTEIEKELKKSKRA